MRNTSKITASILLLTILPILSQTSTCQASPSPISQRQRALHIVHRLATFSGGERGIARLIHLIVSLLGVLGMFSAIVGAFLGPWLTDTGDGPLDEDGFSYWVRDDDHDYIGMGFDCSRSAAMIREEKYRLIRFFDLP